MLVVQSVRAPAAIRHALLDVVPEASDELLFVSAYTTLAGSLILVDAIRRKVGREAYADLRKRLIFSLDFGLSEPEALEMWAAEANATVYVAGVDGLDDCSLNPAVAFHAKAYLVGSEQGHFGGVIGSANMTSRGLTVNGEAGWAAGDLPADAAHVMFEAMRRDVVELSSAILDRYRECRAKLSPPPKPDEIAPVPEPFAVDPRSLASFWDAISLNGLVPSEHDQLWVQISRAEGGSGNQVEMPRGANRFFGEAFNNYDSTSVVPIAQPTLVAGAKVWDDRPLRWHGDNRMERFNLPTLTQGGFDYARSALLFRRLTRGRFEFIVAPWESDLARSWRTASQRAGLVFRVGQGSPRLTGLI
jgi:hypothetical protein